MYKKICTFAGHANIYFKNRDMIKSILKGEIINLIENENVGKFYCGGKGNFDNLCAECVHEVRNDYPFIESDMVLSYIPGKKNKFGIDPYKDFNWTIYPEGLEFVPQKLAIIKRNEWMVNKSSFLIAYIDHEWGGAYKTFKYAKRKKHIKVINLYDLISDITMI